MSEPIESHPQRPELLNILCILTFIGSGLSAIANGFLFLSMEPLQQLLENESTYEFLGTEVNLDFLLEINPVFFLLQSLVLLVSILGAAQMWKLKKIGFHMYTVAQILLLILPKLFINSLPFPTLELLISAIFVYLYSKNLSYLK